MYPNMVSEHRSQVQFPRAMPSGLTTTPGDRALCWVSNVHQNLQVRHCNIIPSDFPKWVFLEQTETVSDETKTISQWKRNYGNNGIAPIYHKYIENP